MTTNNSSEYSTRNQTIANALADMGIEGAPGLEACVANIAMAHWPLSECGEWSIAKHNELLTVYALYEKGSIIENKGRTKHNCRRVLALPFDFDLKDYLPAETDEEVAAMRSLPQPELDALIDTLATTARETCSTLDIPIHRMHNSGYGVHAFAMIASEDQHRVDDINYVHRHLIEKINEHYGQALVDSGGLGAPARLMRVVGSLNLKNPEMPRLVRCIYEDAELPPLRLDDIEIPPREERQRTSHEFIDNEGLSEEEIAEIVAIVEPYWNETKRHWMALYLSGWLAKSHVPEEQAYDIIDRLAVDDRGRDYNDRVRAASDSYNKVTLGKSSGVKGYQEVAKLLEDHPQDLERLSGILTVHWQRVTGRQPGNGTGDDTSDSQAGQRTNGEPSVAAALVALAYEMEADLFHNETGDAFITITDRSYRKTLEIAQADGLLAKQYYQKTKKVAPDAARKEARSTLEGEAIFGDRQFTVFVRLADLGDRLYFDLGDDSWQVVEIDIHGWRVLPSTEVPVKFRRPSGMLALPYPEPGGSLNELDAFINTKDAYDLRLIKGWLVGMFCTRGERAILQFQGEQGTSKSTLAEFLKGIVDPSVAPLRKLPTSEEEFFLSASNTLLPVFDNASSVRADTSNTLCRITSGSGFAKRKLYRDTEEIVVSVKRAILLTGINLVASQSDLLDRTISVELAPLSASQRRSKDTLEGEFKAALPRILGGLFDAVSTALARRGEVSLKELPRLADFALWGEAAGPALGWQPGQFAEALLRNRRELDSIAIEATPLGRALLAFAEKSSDETIWKGTASALLSKLERLEGVFADGRGWPKRPNDLSAKLKFIAPNLRRVGINVIMDQRIGKSGIRTIEITRLAPSS